MDDYQSRITTLEDELATLQKVVNQLEVERQLLHTLVDSLPFYAYVKDAECRLLFSNRLHRQELIGLETNAEALGKSDFDFFPPEEAQAYYDAEQQMLDSGATITDQEVKMSDPNGGARWHLNNKQPVYDAAGEAVGLVGYTSDITPQKLGEAERKRQAEIIEAQKQTLHDLSTPIIPILDRIIVLPLVGQIDTVRARDIMRALLAGIGTYHAQTVILDITGVPVVDSGVADHLNKTVQAAGLKGAHTIITGISDAVAETIVDLGIDWSNIDTLRDLQSGLVTALERLGMQIERRSTKV